MSIRLYKDSPGLDGMVEMLSKHNVPFYVDSNRSNSWFAKNPGHVFNLDYGGFVTWSDNPGDEGYMLVDAFVTGDLTYDELVNLERILHYNALEDGEKYGDPNYMESEYLNFSVLDKFRIETQTKEVKEEKVTHKNNYDFRTHPIPDRDCMLYEVCKPFTDVPYTTAIFNFEEAGHLQFFSALFTIGSWGICREDMDFLFCVWKHLKMPGEYNIENIVKEATEACAQGKIEPRVYRRTIEQVLEKWKETNFIGLRSNRGANQT